MIEDNSLADPTRRGRERSRREFVKTVGATALAASIPSAGSHGVVGGSTPRKVATTGTETPIARFFRSLDETRKAQICFPFEHPLRTRVENNWAIVKPTIGDLTTEQQALCREIFRNLCSEEGYQRFNRQMNDDFGGFANYHVALFGEPDTDQPFEWVLTGRHNTLRADGHRHAGAAFSGPIFHGHAVGDQERAGQGGNVWRYQTEQANALYASFDARQRIQAFFTPKMTGTTGSARPQGTGFECGGLAVAELDGEQKQMVQQLLRDLIRPFHRFDALEIQNCLGEVSGVDQLRLTFYQDGHHGQPWDIWKLEGPAFVWHFHGTPHIHSWLNLTSRAASV
ncbi:Protein of unknown function [Singulisphaera sp. GP187]|uniref:DUF3500 domain-containing protein n=1 Tax=Singulisphaera sp. GP187 TaxID=1882752 RepID=UPI000927AFD3|nr:DUF3500 domain-containing protein [Singulisphaera sp. GP187]SIO58975.1 Protein of unknown function [Singulisphaera sp. GP187]